MVESDRLPVAAAVMAKPLVAMAKKHRYHWLASLPFVVSHLAVLAVFWVGLTWQAVLVAVVVFCVRQVATSAVYHRYFSHRTYKTSRLFQFIMAVLAQTTVQKGALWWAARHRRHHLHTDQEGDPHSPILDGLWYAHVGWILADDGDTDPQAIRDFWQYPELRLLDRPLLNILPGVLLAVGIFALWGWPALIVGFFGATVANWHVTFLVNSVCHRLGRRRFATRDDSRNNAIVALLTFGEGWHNNHHRFASSASIGLAWWEIDVTYYVLRVLAAVGLIWELRPAPRAWRLSSMSNRAMHKSLLVSMSSE